ncbi:VC1465 family Xer recombination activation factor [Variovorax sp. ZT5P49]
MCLDAGLKVPQVAQALQVTERTVYAWFSGKTAVPYAAYKLLRILNRFELPGWPGWHMHSGKLWTPEGFGFDPVDGAWWSLLVRQARAFKGQYDRANRLEDLMQAQGAARAAQAKEVTTLAGAALAAPGPSGLSEGRRAAPPNLFLKHFGTQTRKNTGFSLEKQVSSFAITSIANWSVATNKGGANG